MTREQILALLNQYKPGLFRRIGLRAGQSDEIIAVFNLVNPFPAGELSPTNFDALLGLLNQYKQQATDRESGRIIALINVEMAKDLIDKANYRSIAELIKGTLGEGVNQSKFDHIYSLWLKSYYYDRSHSLILMMQEISGINLGNASTSSSLEHVLAVALLSFLIYETLQAKSSPVISAHFIHTLCQTALAKIKWNNEISSHLDADSQAMMQFMPSLQWWLGLTLELGLDYFTGAGGYLVSAYVGGTAVQSLYNKLTEFVAAPSWLQSYVDQYPATFSCLSKYCSDTAFGLGAYLGSKVYSGVNYFSQSQQNESHSRKEKYQERKEYQERKDDSRQSESNQRKNNEHHKDKSSERKTHDEKPRDEKTNKDNFSENKSYQWENTKDQQHCKTIAPISLSDHEKSLLSREQLCDANKSECLQVVYKIARLETHKTHTRKEVKQAFKLLSLFWHPDKYPADCPNAVTLSEQQMGYVNNAREVWTRIGLSS